MDITIGVKYVIMKDEGSPEADHAHSSKQLYGSSGEEEFVNDLLDTFEGTFDV